jgi:hypothetical protein
MRRTHEDQDQQGLRRRAAAVHGLPEVRRVVPLSRQSYCDLAPAEVASVVWHNFGQPAFCKVWQCHP